MEKLEIKNQALRLSIAIYRITNKFPDNEILTIKFRNLAIEILRDVSHFFYLKKIGQKDNPSPEKKKLTQSAIGKTKVIREYFKVAVAQNWLKEINFEVLDREYKDLEVQLEEIHSESPESRKKSIKPEKSLLKIPSPFISHPSFKTPSFLNSRQQKILAHVKSNGQTKMGNLAEILPNYNFRTLRRDCEKLVRLGLIERNGDNRWAIYKIKPH